ncbi:hypothetical protein FC19_GL000114 [Liquorilactobacillus aquaticus DSM 21051]|uniref:DUF1453 domain-containing protein n=1 Tax=Liquorilactobacillus aquaticus DSM 21051 TaxID=1423725 RepID=A0A0R2CTB6_9LACO|nr:hypothetical protein FC19_GL000114 [Liquorilactobacillus aquaticus DSM 21051]
MITLTIILETLVQIIGRTPFWVWVVLFVLIKRGIKLSQDNSVSLGRSVIMPFIFIYWGLDRVLESFKYPLLTLILYVPMILVGAFFGYLLYRNRKYYVKNNILFQEGSWLPLVIILINFSFKYILNVYMSVNAESMRILNFNLIYAIISGATVGLFLGSLFKSYRAKQLLMG